MVDPALIWFFFVGCQSNEEMIKLVMLISLILRLLSNSPNII